MKFNNRNGRKFLNLTSDFLIVRLKESLQVKGGEITPLPRDKIVDVDHDDDEEEEENEKNEEKKNELENEEEKDKEEETDENEVEIEEKENNEKDVGDKKLYV